MRARLKEERVSRGMTQQVVADELGISLRYYQDIESGLKCGNFRIWDDLEDMFSVHQRKLREIGQEASQL